MRCKACNRPLPTKRQIELRRARQLRYLERKKAKSTPENDR